MKLTDFKYDNVNATDYKLAVASVVVSNNDSISMGSEMNLNTYMNRYNWENKIITVDYDTPLVVEMDLIKMDCNNPNDIYYSEAEAQEIMNWLCGETNVQKGNSENYKPFSPIYDGEESDVLFMGLFTTINAIVVNSNIIGFSVTLTTNSAFGSILYSSTSKNGEMEVNGVSDKAGYYYPNMFEITMKQGGDLEIINSQDDNKTIIKNCRNNEVITIDCSNKIIQTNDNIHKETLANDFNYNYPRVYANHSGVTNVFTTSIDCDFSCSGTLSRRVGIFA